MMTEHTARDAFLARVRRRLHYSQGRAPLSNGWKADDRHRDGAVPQAEAGALLEQFSEEWARLGGAVRTADGIAALPAAIVAIAGELAAETAVRWRVPELEQLDAQGLSLDTELDRAGVRCLAWSPDLEPARLRQAAAAADFGIIAVDWAVAETGTLVLLSGPGRGRSVSLLPPALVAVIPVARVVPQLAGVLRAVASRGREAFPAAINLVSGPSRSADIENDLSIGVHGPGRVYALLLR